MFQNDQSRDNGLNAGKQQPAQEPQQSLQVQCKLDIGAADDRYEQEADTVANQVMKMPDMSAIQRKCAHCEEEEKVQRKPLASFIQKKEESGGTTASEAVSQQINATRGNGSSMDAATASFMESRFGSDFSGVKIHAGSDAIQMSRALNAQAFAVGSDIYFNEGKYNPSSAEGKHLLAHELTHTIQQSGGNIGVSKSGNPGFIQRTPTIDVVDKDFIGPLNAGQRRAAASCPVYCSGVNMGTLNAMGLFYHQSRTGTRTAPAAGDNGVGTALHFQSNGTNRSCSCDDFKIIQIISTTHPAAGRDGAGYVDNNLQNTPFYSDVYLSGTGEHPIPAGYPDAGGTVSSTHSIYDRPARSTAGESTTITWQAEACVACIRNSQPDIIMGGVTYGFTIPYNAATSTFGTIQGMGPNCVGVPSANFERTLRNDPTTSSYSFTIDYGLGDFIINEQMRNMA